MKKILYQKSVVCTIHNDSTNEKRATSNGGIVAFGRQ